MRWPFLFNRVMQSEIEHLDRGERGLFALVAIFPPRTIQRLLFIQRCDHAKDHWLPGFQSSLGDPVGNGLTDIIKMRRVPLDDASQTNYGINFLFFRHPQTSQRKLERTWNILANDMVFLHAMTYERGNRAFV